MTTNIIFDIMSLVSILTNGGELKKFSAYCDKKYCSENLTFWIAVQEFKLIDEEVLRNLRARALFDKYIVNGAPLQINLDEPVVLAIQTAIHNTATPRNLFDSAEKSVEYLMETDVLPGYRASQKSSPKATPQDASEISVVGEWNHSKLPSNSNLAKKLGKELVKLDFEKKAIGMDTLKAEEENSRLDQWCRILEKESETNKKQIHRLQKTAMQLLAETEYLKNRELILKETIERTLETIRTINDSPLGV